MFNFFKKKSDEKENNEKKSLKEVLSNTINSLVGNVINSVQNEKIDEFELENIETMLIKADLGVDLALEITEEIKNKNIKLSELKAFLKEKFSSILNIDKDDKLKEGSKVLLVAGDTFRAAAEEQLDIWSQRAGVDILREDKANSAALVYKGIDNARTEGYSVVIIDSAGRLQNKFNLIEELKKIKNVILKKLQNDNLETILVLDGSQGQNGLNQALVFNEAVEIDSIAITKLDGSAKGGIILSIAKQLNLPAKLIGTGEKIDDLEEFNRSEFISALFE